MSRVFVAEETSLGRKVVVKVLPPDLAATINVERFRREIQLAARLQHAHIVPLLSAGVADGLPYYTMPLVDGESLRARIARGGELPVNEAITIMREVASALSYAHEHGVVHRDIKPENVLVTKHHSVVIDFGVAKALSAATDLAGPLTSIGMTIGTPAYMSPEQAVGDPAADHRTDIYALGAVTYEMLTGAPVFSERPSQAMIRAHAIENPEPIEVRRPNVPPALAAVVMQMLEKHPADRPQSADEVLRFLDGIHATPTSAAAATPRGSAGRPVAARPFKPNRRTAAYAIATALILVALALSATRFLRSRTSAVRSSGAAATVADAAKIPSIGVMPFANLSDDRSTDYFSDGMTEELIAALSKIEGLRVPARSSSFALKGKNLDIRSVGEMLGVASVLEGAVRRSGNKLRVTAQLVDAQSGYHLWSETFDREMSDIFAVQDEIARAIVSVLRLKLAGREAGGTLVQAPTQNLEAYDLYLKARFAWNERSPRGVSQATAYLQEAIAKDPNFALAYAGLADVYAVSATVLRRPLTEFAPRTESAARKALALDGTLAEPHATLGTLADDTYDYPGAEREYRRSIELNPRYPTARHWYGLMLLCTGRAAEAKEQLRQGMALDPLSRAIGTVYGMVFWATGDQDAAIAQYRKVLEFDPSFALARGWLARSLAEKGDYDGALAELRRIEMTTGLPEAGDVGYTLGRWGRVTEARAVLDTLLKRTQAEYVPPSSLALIYAGLGDGENAIKWLEKALDAGDPWARCVKVDPRFAPFRQDPRYARALGKANLEP